MATRARSCSSSRPRASALRPRRRPISRTSTWSNWQTENPKALEARQLRDTYHYFGCKPGLPTYRYDIIDAVKDPEGPFLCLPKIFDLRSDITTKALAE